MTRCATCHRYTTRGRLQCVTCLPTLDHPGRRFARWVRQQEARPGHPRGPRVGTDGGRYEPVPGDLTSAQIKAIIAGELARIRHARGDSE